MTITTRAAKGVALTHAEMDENFTDARDGVALQVPKTRGEGLKIDSLGTPGFGWHDLVGNLHVNDSDPNAGAYATFINGIKVIQLAVNKEGFVNFHLPHDYLMGSPIFMHVHWSHNSATVTGGSVTWVFETTYAKGHDQAAFHASKLISIVQNASLVQYQHMTAETAASTAGGSATQLDTDELEVDGLILTRLYLDSNDMTDTVVPPDPFVHFVDIHYQSTGVPTKQRAPDFWT